MSYPQFDRSRLCLRPLSERIHDIDRSIMLDPKTVTSSFEDPAIPALAERILEARKRRAAVIAFCGAHVLRKGNGPLLIDLMEKGLLTHLALNGAGAIHDFELAMIGATCESVARYIRTGEFGLWQETGRINDVAVTAARENLGLGEALGRTIEIEEFPYRQTSVLAAGYRLRVPVTVHVAIGQDIVHEHPNFDPAATGQATFTDFLIFAHSVSNLEGGVYLNVGSAVAGPEVYLKALSMARNVAPAGKPQHMPPDDGRFRSAHNRRRLVSRGPEDRPPLLLPAVQDRPRPYCCRWGNQLLHSGRSPRDDTGPLSSCDEPMGKAKDVM
jgi:hypothetical protein